MNEIRDNLPDWIVHLDVWNLCGVRTFQLMAIYCIVENFFADKDAFHEIPPTLIIEIVWKKRQDGLGADRDVSVDQIVAQINAAVLFQHFLSISKQLKWN